ncbi:MAG: hypothetical protein GY730_07645 [bacterium]|nr:hypothetical protein [bacterium]
MLYREWAELVRKFNPSDKCYPNWGGAGLKLCKKWTEFSNFKEDMQQLYKLGEKLYIKNVPDLILNNKTVSKDTCIWAKTRKNQESIQSYYVKYYGKDTLLNEIYNRFHKDLSYNTVYQRIARYKWPVMKALKASAPKKKKKTARNEQKVENKSE